MRAALIISLALLAAAPANAQPSGSSVEAQLCRSQLELLASRNRLTAEERARFEKQCDCLDGLADARDTAACAASPEDM